MPLLYFLIWLHCSMCHPCCDVGSFVVHELQVVLMVKNLPASAGDIPGLGRLDLSGLGRSLEEGMAAHCSILA